MATITEQREEVSAALATLHEQVENITTSEQWTAWLAFLSSMHDYSPLNRLWMWAQWEQRRAEDPTLPPFTMPAAFSFWKDHGRMVRKGERALSVLAPIIVTDREAPPRPDGKPRTKCVGFKLKRRTFDVSQTEGADLPADPTRVERIMGEGDPDAFDRLAAVVRLAGWDVRDGMPDGLPSGALGVCVFSTRTLHVQVGGSGAERLATLIHETAHALLHSPEEYGSAHLPGARNVAEVEAESVAYVVAHRLGFDTTPFSVGYVAGWSRGNGAMVARTAERVIDTADRILTALADGVLPAPRGAARPQKDDGGAE